MLAFRTGITIVTFFAGVAFHFAVLRLEPALEPILEPAVSFLDFHEANIGDSFALSESPRTQPCYVVLCMDRNRNFYLGKQLISLPEYPNTQLMATLSAALGRCNQELAEAQSKELEDPILTTISRDRIVYFKLFKPHSDDVQKLVEAARASGADYTFIVRDQLKKR